MKAKPIYRTLLLAIGLCAVLVILLSHSFYKESHQAAPSEKSKDKTEVSIQTPSEVTPQGQIGIVNDQNAAVVKELVTDEHKNETFAFVRKSVIGFLKTLFRVIISPNAP
ncbi:MAG: hypothetical protein JST69_09640 [Bacteroidetes bacterium]|nr:hypothetical protein [Bacteroidota bacterium]